MNEYKTYLKYTIILPIKIKCSTIRALAKQNYGPLKELKTIWTLKIGVLYRVYQKLFIIRICDV